MATSDETRGEELAELARQFFLWLRDNELPGVTGFKGMTPQEFRMNAGIYRKLELPLGGKVVQFWGDEKEEGRLTSLSLGVRHVLLYANHDLYMGGGDEEFEANRLYFDRSSDGDIEQPGSLTFKYPVLDSAKADAEGLSSWIYMTFAGLIGRADLVWDDAKEAKRIGFAKTYRWIFDYETPRPAYEANVRDLIPIDDVGGLSAFREHLYWYATYENRVYVREDGGDYYRKWKKKAPVAKEHREFRPTKLSDTYLKECFHELVLKKGDEYLLVELPGLQLVYRLVVTPAKGTKPAKLTVKLVFKFQDLLYLGTDDKLEITPPVTAILFHALDGGKHQPSQLGDRGHAELAGVGSGRFAYDYKQAVRWFLGNDRADPGDDVDWFNAFVDLLFPDAAYAVDGTVAHAAACTWSIEELVAQVSGATGTIADQLDALVEVARKSPETRFVMKGAYYGTSEKKRRQLIGVSKGYVYEWYPETSLVTRMGFGDWCQDNYIGSLAAQIYENTRGMIPIAMAVTWGGIIVAGGAIAGVGGPLAHVARNQIQQLVKDEIAKRLVKKLIRQFRPQLIALVADGILALVPQTDSVLFELLRGFVHGFGAGAVDHYLSTIDDRFEKEVKRLYKRALRKVTGGVDRAYQLYRKLSAAYTKLQGVFAGLKAVWTPQLAETAGVALVLVGRDLAIAMVVTVFVLAYTDYVVREGRRDQAKRDAWVRSQRDALKFMIKETGEELADYAEALREDLTGSTPPSSDLVRERNDRLAAAIASAVIKAPTEAPGAMEIFREVFAELGIDSWEELMGMGFLELVARGYDAFTAAHPDFEVKAAKVIGEALGEFVGTIFLERAVMPEKWRKQKITGNKMFDKSIRKVLGGGTAPALWKLARVPLDELRKLVATTKDDLRSLPSDTPDVFERVQRDDTMYRDLLRELMRHENELGDSLGRLALDEELPGRIRDLVGRVETDAPPDVATLLEIDDPDWPRDALLFVLQTWLRVAMTQLLRAFDVLEDSEPFGGEFRLATLLEIVGLEVGLDDKTAAALAVKFERAF
jgi:hypothetical protein